MAKKYSELRKKMSPAAREAAQQKTQQMLAELPLRELRHARELSQQTIARTMGTAQSEVSKIEARTDMYVSTLRSYVEAMGGRLEIIATFPEGRFQINQFGDLEEPDLKRVAG